MSKGQIIQLKLCCIAYNVLTGKYKMKRVHVPVPKNVQREIFNY